VGHPRVALVGAGPGDPGLVTARGLELLARAEVVVVDYLIDPRLRRLIGGDAAVVDVGKRPGQPSMTQAEINARLIELARVHELVVRLKGGDPFVFGRGGEEVEALLAAGIAVEVVPGVTSALAGPARAGIPVTHRGVADGYLVLTGHRHADAPLVYDWQSIVATGLTIVVLMGVGHRAAIAEALLGAGMPPSTPVAACHSVTWPQEAFVRTTLERLGQAAIESPSVLVIGEAAGSGLSWQESLPLGGVRVHSTRPESGDDELIRTLADLGAIPIVGPTIAIGPPSDGGAALEAALGRLESYDWLVFTSANGVRATLDRLADLRALGGLRIACLGPGTARTLASYRLVADLVPDRFVGEALVEAFPEGHGRVMIPRAKVARTTVPDGLAAKGWSVEVVEAYETTHPAAEIAREVAAAADVTIFTAASTVEGYLTQYPGLQPRRAVAIGPITAERLRARDIAVAGIAAEYSIAGVVDLLVDLVGHGRLREEPGWSRYQPG
jgi:uroporphyrinogen III methyltransferase/synthase